MENKNETSTPKVEKNKMSKLPIIIVLLVIVFAIGAFYVYENDKQQQVADGKIPGLKEDSQTGRKFIKFDITLKETIEGLSESEEINQEPYRNSSLMGGQVTFDQNFTGHPIDSFADLEPTNGKLGWYINGGSLRTSEDEEVNPDEVNAFNYFWSAMDVMGDESGTLNDDEVEAFAKKAEQLAIDDTNPAAVYVGDLIRNLKGEKPTKQSVYYLMIANRIHPSFITSIESLDDKSEYLDRTYQTEQDRSLVHSFTENFEKVTDSLGIVHWYFDGSMTRYAIEDFIANGVPLYAGSDRTTELKEGVMEVGHYKDISNYMLAEYFVANGNMGYKMEAMGLMDSSYSKQKSAFTWFISPKIEEIASAYYDIVEPLVYKGRFESREAAYKETKSRLADKYSIEEIKSAVMTYEFWALQR